MNIEIIYLIVAFFLLVFSLFKDKEKTKRSLKVSYKMALKMLPILLLVFILMGCIQALVSKGTFTSLLSSSRGIFSIIVAELIGSVALIMPAAVFPFAGFLHESGAGYGVLVGFIMTSILIGISTVPLELKIFGKKFTLVRNILTFLFILLIAIIFRRIL